MKAMYLDFSMIDHSANLISSSLRVDVSLWMQKGPACYKRELELFNLAWKLLIRLNEDIFFNVIIIQMQHLWCKNSNYPAFMVKSLL